MRQIDLQNIVWQEDKHFVAQCLNIDISSFGQSKEEALANLKEAIELYFEDASSDEIQSIKNPEIVTTYLARA